MQDIIVLNSTEVTDFQRAEYSRLKAQAKQGWLLFAEAITKIHSEKLYKVEYSTFEEFCEIELGMAQSRAYQFLDSAKVVANLKSSTMVELLPQNERQTRPLTKLEPEAQPMVWEAVKETIKESETGETMQVTAKKIQEVVNDFASVNDVFKEQREKEKALQDETDRLEKERLAREKQAEIEAKQRAEREAFMKSEKEKREALERELALAREKAQKEKAELEQKHLQEQARLRAEAQEKAQDEAKRILQERENERLAKINNRKAEIERQREQINSNAFEKPNGLFSVISIDPPWAYEEKGGFSSEQHDPISNRGGVDYPTMSVAQIKEIELPIETDAVVFLWTTHAFLRDAFDILENWGLTYKATMVWDKEMMGMGRTVRMQCEFCLIGFKGKPLFVGSGERDIIRAKRREHSRKPDEFFAFVDRACAGRKLEYFSREAREGWAIFGNDTTKFD